MLKMERPLRCPIACLKCGCCLQEMRVSDATGKNLGYVQEDGCWCLVPRFNIYRPDGTAEFGLKQPTCCGGLCVNCCAEGCMACCMCRVPVNVYAGGGDITPATQPVGKITKVWAGLGAELIGSHSFELVSPAATGPVTRARLLAATFLMNVTLFSVEDQQNQAL